MSKGNMEVCPQICLGGGGGVRILLCYALIEINPENVP